METFYEQIKGVLTDARQHAYRAVNFAMVEAYWHIGRLIVEEEQQGNSRAEYGSGLLKYLAERLTQDFGKGFDEREMRRIRQFYLTFQIRDALRPELSWTHYRFLLKVDNPAARAWYIAEAAEQQWSSRALERQVNLFYYERLLATREIDRALKIGKLTHQDVGQMDMYVRMYEEHHKQPDDNPTIGLILCTEKNETVVKYSVLNGSQQLFASKYKLFLPTEEELMAEIERDKQLLEQNRRIK